MSNTHAGMHVATTLCHIYSSSTHFTNDERKIQIHKRFRFVNPCRVCSDMMTACNSLNCCYQKSLTTDRSQQDELRSGEEIAHCPSCSLYITVVYDPVSHPIFTLHTSHFTLHRPLPKPVSCFKPCASGSQQTWGETRHFGPDPM